ncbi:thioredoxin-like protein [Lipomyces arxii]|uniref:thioredoxin-like protein n=1 Tax=Lipomyces arxii TaxID=56418 RepID=UPI0034CEB052
MLAQLRFLSQTGLRAGRSGARMFHTSTISRIAIGDAVPTVPLYGQSPGDEVNLAALTKSGKFIFVFVPGAYSPACSARHVPGYVSLADQFASKDVNGIYVISGNDAFVMNSWGKSIGTAGGKIKYLADPTLKFVTGFGLDFDASKFFGNHRSKRAAVLVKDGKVSKTWVEPDNTGISVSEAKNVMDEL